MTYGDLLNHGRIILKRAEVDNYHRDALTLMRHAADMPLHTLIAQKNDTVPKHIQTRYNEFIGRRAAREPLQYITGECEFMSLRFSVSPAVLIPRQDTETLAEYVISRLNKAARTDVLDIGCGSGALSVSIAFYAKGVYVDALDVSAVALELTGFNAAAHGVDGRINRVLADIFNIKETEKQYGVIVSNPPYIPTADIAALMPEVSGHEPLIALDGGADGMTFYRHIVPLAWRCLEGGGLLALETSAYLAEELARLTQSIGFDTDTVRDYSGLPRVVIGIKPCCDAP